MADNSVFITGVADGAFENALGSLPPWSTEKTAVTIEGILRKSLGIQTKLLSEAIKCCKGAGSGSLSPAEARKLNDELEKTLKLYRRMDDEGRKKLKRDKEEEKVDKDGLLTGKKLKGTSEKLTYVLTGLAAVGSKVLKTNEEYIDVYDSLYKSGINVLNGNESTADGFEALNQLVNQTGLRLQILQKVAEKYSTTMNVVGMTKFGKAVAMSNTRMQELGFSSAENAELIGAMMESEKGYSDIRGKTSEQIAADAMKLGQQFGRLSQTVGISRQQLLDNLQSNAKSSESTMVAATWGAKAAENMAKVVSGMKDQDLGKMFLQMASAADPIFTQAYKDLQDSGMGPLAMQLGRLSQDMRSLDPVEAQRRLDSLVEEISPGDIKALNSQMAAGSSSAKASLDTINKLQQQARGISQATGSQQDAATNTEASIAKLQTETERLSALAQAAFFPMVSQVNLVADSMKKLNDALYGAIGAVNAETRSWLGVGLIIAGFSAAILGMTKTVSTFLSLFGKAGAAVSSALNGLGSIFLRFAGPVAALYAAFQLGTAIGETIMEAITGVKTSIDYIEIIGDILKSTGEWFSGIFSTVGKWVSGGMDSLKAGLDKIYDIAPWIQKVVDFVSKFVSGVISKFASKMSFGLIGSETSEFTKPDDRDGSYAAAESKRVSRISVPTTPMASTIVSPSAVEVQPPKVQGVSNQVDTRVSSATATQKVETKADINNMLSFQSNLLEQILLSSNNLVSVNREILRYTRNNA